MRLLLVDDDPEIRLIAGFVLRDAGHDVIEAEDSRSARAQLDANDPDVIVMDVLLGVEDGIDAAARLLDGRGDRPRLVFLTGANRADQVARMRAAGACGILHKPFDPAGLAAALDAALAGHGG
jgi:DNA-binding response OmpR family regulator